VASRWLFAALVIVGHARGTTGKTRLRAGKGPMRTILNYSTVVVIGLGLALTGACSGGPGPDPVVQETSGLLGNGVFRWSCIDGSDSTCGTGVFPSAIALGSRFDLLFIRAEDVPDGLGSSTIEPVSPSRINRDLGELVAQRAGDVSLAAFAGGYALDYIDVTLRPIDDLKLSERDEAEAEAEAEPEPEPCDDYDHDGVCDDGEIGSYGPVSLVVGEDTEVRARPFGGGADLAGALPYAWENLTPDVLRVEPLEGRHARLTVLTKGTAQLSVRAGDFVKVFEYEVQDPPPEPDDTGSEESDESSAGSATGSSSDTGTGTESGTDGETDGATTTGGMQ
jgi:hypothetical protein